MNESINPVYGANSRDNLTSLRTDDWLPSQHNPWNGRMSYILAHYSSSARLKSLHIEKRLAL